MENYVGEITFKGRKSFDTLEEANEYKKKLGNRFKTCYKLEYSDFTFFVVEYDEE